MTRVLLSMSFFLIGVLVASCQNTGAPSMGDGYKLLSVSDYKAKLKNDAGQYQLVDVRTSDEYSQGHIEGSQNIDFLNPVAFETEFNKLDKNKPLMIYCRSGSRSRRAAEKLQAMGFKKIFDLEGGYRMWEQQ